MNFNLKEKETRKTNEWEKSSKHFYGKKSKIMRE
jgi:hypothetical protein